MIAEASTNTPNRAMIADVAASILSRATTAHAVIANSDQLQPRGRVLLGPFFHNKWPCGRRVII
jgi:hypothetical protein